MWGVTLQLPRAPASARPGERAELPHGGRSLTLSRGCLSGVFSPQNLGRIWRKKEPDAQKPRLNKACSGRAAAYGPGSRTARREGGSVWLLAHGGAGPRGGDREGAFCSAGTRAGRPNRGGGGVRTCI